MLGLVMNLGWFKFACLLKTPRATACDWDRTGEVVGIETPYLDFMVAQRLLCLKGMGQLLNWRMKTIKRVQVINSAF